MRVAFDVSDTLIHGFDIDRPREHVMNLYRAFRQMPNVHLILWSSDIELAREVMSKYGLQPDELHDKSQGMIQERVDLAFDDKPEYVRMKAEKVFSI